MMVSKTLTGSMMALAAAGLAVPAQAAPVSAAANMPINIDQLRTSPLDSAQWDEDDQVAERWRRRCGFFGCRRRRGIRGGQILAGALIIGGIAAIATANNNRRRDREIVIRDERRDDIRDDRRDDRRDDQRRNGTQLSDAVDQCTFAVQSQTGDEGRVDRISTVARDGAGWRVEGQISYPQGRESFQCGVTAGQVDFIQIGAGNEEL